MQHGACVYGTVLPVTTHHPEAAALPEDCSGEGLGLFSPGMTYVFNQRPLMVRTPPQPGHTGPKIKGWE